MWDNLVDENVDESELLEEWEQRRFMRDLYKHRGSINSSDLLLEILLQILVRNYIIIDQTCKN